MFARNARHAFKFGAAVLSLAILGLVPAFAEEEAADTSDFTALLGGDAEAPGKSALSIGGTAEVSVRAYLDEDALNAVGDDEDTADVLEATPSARVDLSYSASASELVVNLRADQDRLSDHPEDVLDEAYMRAFLSDFSLEAGKMKVVWGKGDELHVVDLFNADDYTDFIFPDYADRRLGEVMFRGIWNAPSGTWRAETVWTPTMTADRIPTTGPWAGAAAKKLTSLAEDYVAALYADTYSSTYASAYAQALSAGYSASAAAVAAQASASAAGTRLLSEYSDSSAFLPGTSSFDYGQFGLRTTGTIGPVDLGVSYYLGHYKTPSASIAYGSDGSISDFSLAYDRLQSFGAEAAFAVGMFNFRFESAYYLTEDIEGDDPSVHNNSLNWVAGFDVALPVHNATVNVQTIGSYVLGGDGIDSPVDVDYDEDDIRSNDKIVVKLGDSFAHEKIKPEVKVLWGIERNDFILMPAVALVVRNDFVVDFSGAFFLGSEDGEFGDFVDNDFARIVATYKF